MLRNSFTISSTETGVGEEKKQNPETDIDGNQNPVTDSQETQNPENMEINENQNPETDSQEKQNPETESEEKQNTEREPEMKSDSGEKITEFCEEDEVSPRGVMEIPVSGTDSDQSSSSSSSSSSGEKAAAGQCQRGQWKNVLELLKRKSVRRFSTMPFLAASYEMSKRNLRRKQLARIRSADEGRVVDCEGFMAAKPSWRSFDHAELAAATTNFSPGEGIFF